MSRAVTINGVSLVYEEAGQGTAFVTLHGGPGMSGRNGDWATFQPLTDRFRLVSYDQRGSGESEGAEPYSHAQFVADLEALRQNLQLGRMVLLGGSYGGFVALEYALTYPQHLHALILRDTAASNRFQGTSKEKAMASGFPMDEVTLDRLFSGEVRDDQDFRDSYAMIQPLYTVERDPGEGGRATGPDSFPVSDPQLGLLAQPARLRPGVPAARDHAAGTRHGRPPRLDHAAGGERGAGRRPAEQRTGDLRAQRPFASERGAGAVSGDRPELSGAAPQHRGHALTLLAAPISREERAGRAREAFGHLSTPVDALVLFDDQFIFYYSGFAFFPTERPIALLITPDGERTLLVPRLEREHAQQTSEAEQVVDYPEFPGPSHPLGQLADLLTRKRLDSAQIGVDHDGYPSVMGYDGPPLSVQLPQARVSRVSRALDHQMSLKSPAELALIRESARWGAHAHRLPSGLHPRG